jgi:hypothetical protein
MILTVADDTIYEDHGTVVTLEGTDEQGRKHTFGADWRSAQAIRAALDIESAIDVEVEDWQLLGASR